MILGIEGTAHTFGIGIFDGKILADVRDSYKPKQGSGIHPTEAAEHHERVKEKILQQALDEAGITMDDIDTIAYSKGPGLPPCLLRVVNFIKEIGQGKKIIEVNHPVAHIEIARFLTGARDPIVIYVSGGNTQIIGYAGGCYRVFGETLDIPIGNALDTFARGLGLPFPGGPEIEKLAEQSQKKYSELPYVVKGMDLSFSGIVTAALNKWEEGRKENKTDEKKNDENKKNLCYSFQETCYAMLAEVTERAMAHTGKQEVVLTGGVAASKRLRDMLDIMATERGAKAFVCPIEYSGDNGTMIAVAGHVAQKAGQKPISADEADFDPKWRVDEVDVKWM